MIEWESELHQPQMELSIDLSVSVKSISDWPDNMDEFGMWLANKVVEVGSGQHQEYYIQDGNYENDIEVNFSVLMRSMSILKDTK